MPVGEAVFPASPFPFSLFAYVSDVLQGCCGPMISRKGGKPGATVPFGQSHLIISTFHTLHTCTTFLFRGVVPCSAGNGKSLCYSDISACDFPLSALWTRVRREIFFGRRHQLTQVPPTGRRGLEDFIGYARDQVSWTQAVSVPLTEPNRT